MTLNDYLLLFAVLSVAGFALMQTIVVNGMLKAMSKRLFEMEDRKASESEIWVKCDVCGWSVNAVFDDDDEPEFPIECHNCGLNAVEPIEEE